MVVGLHVTSKPRQYKIFLVYNVVYSANCVIIRCLPYQKKSKRALQLHTIHRGWSLNCPLAWGNWKNITALENVGKRCGMKSYVNPSIPHFFVRLMIEFHVWARLIILFRSKSIPMTPTQTKCSIFDRGFIHFIVAYMFFALSFIPPQMGNNLVIRGKKGIT